MRFSPDGRRLRFTLSNKQDGSTAIWEVGTDGKDLHPAFPGWHNPSRECCGAWIPDSSYYFFVSGGQNDEQLYVAGEKRGLFRKRSDPVQLTSGPMLFTYAVSSPDGKKVYADGYLPRSELVRYDSHARGFVPFLSGTSADYVAFSRDGKWVTYVSVPENTLWRSRVEPSGNEPIIKPEVVAQLDHSPRWQK